MIKNKSIVIKQGLHDKYINLTAFDNILILDIRYNKLESIILPPNIVELYCCYNKFAVCPDFSQFGSLEIIHISNNKILKLSALPKSIKKLNISNNLISHIDDIPDSITKLNISNNPIIIIDKFPLSLTKLFATGLFAFELPNLPTNLKLLHVDKEIKLPYKHHLEIYYHEYYDDVQIQNSSDSNDSDENDWNFDDIDDEFGIFSDPRKSRNDNFKLNNHSNSNSNSNRNRNHNNSSNMEFNYYDFMFDDFNSNSNNRTCISIYNTETIEI